MMKSKRTDNIVLMERDRKLFVLLFEQKVMTFAQIREIIFGNISRQAVENRLAKLAKKKCIRKNVTLIDGKVTRIFELSALGYKELKLFYHNKIINKKFKSGTPYHDIELVTLRNMLSKLSQVENYYSENLLQNCEKYLDSSKFNSFITVNSDAVLKLNIKGKEYYVAIEYEASMKSKAKYNEKLLEYYFSRDVIAIFYICKSKPIQTQIMKIEREICKDFKSKMYFTQLKDVYKDTSKITFTNIEEGRFVIK